MSSWPNKILPVVVALLLSATALRAEYQWSVTVPPGPGGNQKPGSPPRAFLWIPPTCSHVRAVVLGQQNMIEQGILDSPGFRQTMSELGFAIVWVSPSFDLVFHFEDGAGDRVEAMMKSLAQESGYRELEFAPIAPIGHSAHASYPWNFAAWNPSRTLAVLSVHGDAPLTNRTGSGRPNPDWGNRSIDGVPGLMVMGEYEWHQDRLDPALDFQQKHPGVTISVLADVGHGHFDYSSQMIGYLGLFLRKAALLRLPVDAPLDAPVALKPINPRSGWLVDQWRQGAPRQSPAAPYDNYKGDRAAAFWCFDEEIALATERFNDQRGRQPQLLGFAQDGQVIVQTKSHQQVTPKFSPEADGLSFKLQGVFIDTVPEGNPVGWTGLPAGSPIGHATGGGPVMVTRICGPVVPTGPETWTVRFNRASDVTDRAKTGEQIWLLASQEGDEKYKSAVQQALINLPMRNQTGADQQITFPEIKDQTNATAFLKLNATSDAGVTVSYYVREGPAEIDGDILRFTAIPPRARYPLKVTVIAWQYGRASEVKLKSAEPVARTFSILP